MRIVTFGAGYVGLVTAAGLSELGHDVLCVDIDVARVSRLRDGLLPIHEPGLGEIVRRNIRSGRLNFSGAIAAPFREADVYFIAVGTPAAADGSADLSAVIAAGDDIARTAARSAVVAVKSTVPVGTCDMLQARISAVASVGLEVVSNPEFLKEGAAVDDFMHPDRIVIGARSEAAATSLRELYAPLLLRADRVVVTDVRSSEIIKYASNAMLAMRISFMNEMSRLCDAAGANVHAVRAGVGADSRIGRQFLYAGPGYGGSCFPKDVQALAAVGLQHGVRLRLVEATGEANREQLEYVAKGIEDALGGFAGKTLAFWGLAFKPETDDVREAPAVILGKRFLAAGARIVGHDPEAGDSYRQAVPGDVTVVDREYDALDGADALVLWTEWRCYRAPRFAEIARRLRPGAWVIDARNTWRGSDLAAVGLRYRGVGVGSVP